MRWVKSVLTIGLVASCGALTAAAAPDPMGWAYPHPDHRDLPTIFKKQPVYTVPGSKLRYTQAQLDEEFAIPDWFPGEHPAMPAIVAHGRQPDVMPCGYCHLANGQGTYGIPNLSGLSTSYIVDQLAAFRKGQRKPSMPIRDAEDMARIATHVSAADGEAAAAYFAGLKHQRWITVREARAVPVFGPTYWGAYQPVPGRGTIPLGERIIELPLDQQRAALHDPHSGYVAYVPVGSVAEGRAIAAQGFGGEPACASCHGANLAGNGIAPPLAGRSPSYLARQLWDMHTGHRTGGNAMMMQPIAAKLTPHAITAVAAYAASLNP